MATLIRFTGWEHGITPITAAGGGLGATVNGTPTVQGVVVHSGSYALRCQTASAATNIQFAVTPSQATLVGVLYVRYAAWPSVDNEITYAIPGAGLTPSIKLRAATHRLFARFWSGTDGAEHPTVLQLNTWYRVDFRIDCSANPNTIDFQVDGVAATQHSAAQAATTLSLASVGGSNTGSVDSYYDDFALSGTSGDYPIGPIAGELLYPVSDDTHAAAGVIANTAGTVINGTTVTAWDLVDERPPTSLLDYVQQTAISVGAYAAVKFIQTSRNGILGVAGLLAYHSSAAVANAAAARVRDAGGVDSTIHTGDMSGTAIAYKTSTIANPAGGWSAAAVNALIGRMGYASNVGSIPYFDALLLEVAYNPTAPAGSSSKRKRGRLTPI